MSTIDSIRQRARDLQTQVTALNDAIAVGGNGALDLALDEVSAWYMAAGDVLSDTTKLTVAIRRARLAAEDVARRG